MALSGTLSIAGKAGVRAIPHPLSLTSMRVRPYAPVNQSLLLRKADHCACGGGCPACQTKSKGLRVSQPNDPAEIEADRIADIVMRMSEQGVSPVEPDQGSNGTDLQRTCTACEEDEEPLLQTKVDSSSAAFQRDSGIEPPSVRHVLSSAGEALSPETRAFFEPRFGRDLSGVRVHTGSVAERSARDVSAHAYTVGHHIVFGSGRFTPETDTGRRLIAHELTHVVQQAGTHENHPTGTQKISGHSAISAISRLAVIARKGNGLSKEEIQEGEKRRDATALFWNDLKTYFPGEGRKLAGSGYDGTIDYLTTSFQEGQTIEEGIPTSRSAPMVYVGKRYLDEQDVEKRKAAIKAELDKIDVFRYDSARIDNDDLSNAVITSKIDNLDIMGKREYLQRLEAQQFMKNGQVQEYIRRLLPSTPLVAGATPTREGGFELKFENITIIVKPDVFNSSAVAADEAHTELKRIDTETYKTKPGFTWGANQKVNSMTFRPSIPRLIYKVETHYGPQSDPSYTSGYGVGTRPEDTAGHTSIRFHEGMHGTVFITSIKDNITQNSFPTFTGKLGDDKDEFGKAVDAYEKGVLAFDQMLKDAVESSEQAVDCVGKTIEEFHGEKGTVSRVTCKNP